MLAYWSQINDRTKERATDRKEHSRWDTGNYKGDVGSGAELMSYLSGYIGVIAFGIHSIVCLL